MTRNSKQAAQAFLEKLCKDLTRNKHLYPHLDPSDIFSEARTCVFCHARVKLYDNSNLLQLSEFKSNCSVKKYHFSLFCKFVLTNIYPVINSDLVFLHRFMSLFSLL